MPPPAGAMEMAPQTLGKIRLGVEAQTRQCLGNLFHVLAAGLTPDDVVAVQVYPGQYERFLDDE
jgi:enamine deaminase RidA (YjgF/YER057c/UK114 family)